MTKSSRQTGSVPVEEFGAALGAIRDDIGEVKETVTTTRETVIRLETEQKYTNGRVGRLEGANETEYENCPNTTAIDGVKKHITKFVYWALGATVLLVIGGFSWYENKGAQSETLKQHSKTLDTLNDNVKLLNSSTTSQTKEVKQARQSVDKVRVEFVEESKRGPSFEEWYQTLNPREQKHLKRQFDREVLRPPATNVDGGVE